MFCKQVHTQQNPNKPCSTHSTLHPQKNITKLFQPPYRQIFQLDYLYASPLCQTYPAYNQVLQLIQNFNQQTVQIQQNRRLPTFNALKIICIRFIYREMLTIAVMGQQEINNNDYAGKLKNWYFQLTERHSIFQGVNFKKKASQVQKIEDLIRKSYVSNVFDEIDDYFRKKMVQHESQKDLRKTTDQILPMIDIQLYRREDANMRKYRQKTKEAKYFKEILSKKAHMRQNSLKKIQSKQFKKGSTLSDLTNSMMQRASMHTISGNFKSENFGKLVKNSICTQDNDWTVAKNIKDLMHLKKRERKETLLNINGINLIQCEME